MFVKLKEVKYFKEITDKPCNAKSFKEMKRLKSLQKAEARTQARTYDGIF